MNAIETWQFTKAYDDNVAVENLSLTVPAGCLFGFLGRNGSGKSTTIGCLTGLLRASGGDLRVLGEAMGPDAVTVKRRIGVMPEALGLFDGLYAHEFLAFQARMYGVDRLAARQRVTELLEAFELQDEGQKPLGEFSAGMRKRVAFAAAIIHSPELVFLDEPFESVDPAGAAVMKDWLRRMTAQGRTVFMTTHVLDTVERLCDRIAIITRPGKIVWEGRLSPLATAGSLSLDDREFGTLEALFLHVAGESPARSLSWL